MWTWQSVDSRVSLPALIALLNERLRSLTGAIAEFLRRIEGVATWKDGDTTPSIRGASLFQTANTGATSVTRFDDGRRGQKIEVLFDDGNTTLVQGTNLKLSGGVDYTGSAGKVLRFVSEDGTVFREVPNR